MDKLNLMGSFIAVAEQGSFTGAARQLGKTKALVSTHVSQLENWLKIRLITRSTRSMTLTPEGRSYYEQAKRILDDIATLESDLLYQNRNLVGRLRISAPTTFGEMVLMPYISEITTANPDLDIDLMLSDRYVDLIGEGFDMAIRIGALQDSSLIARHAGNMEMILCAAPAFLEQFGEPTQLSDLQQLPCIFDSNLREGSGWSFYNDLGSVEIKPNFVVRINSALAAASLARTGTVITNCPDFAVRNMIQRGELVPILQQYKQRDFPVSILYPHRQHLSAKVKTFADGLIEYLNNN